MDDADRKAREIVRGLKLKERLATEGDVYVAESIATALREAERRGMVRAAAELRLWAGENAADGFDEDLLDMGAHAIESAATEGE